MNKLVIEKMFTGKQNYCNTKIHLSAHNILKYERITLLLSFRNIVYFHAIADVPVPT